MSAEYEPDAKLPEWRTRSDRGGLVVLHVRPTPAAQIACGPWQYWAFYKDTLRAGYAIGCQTERQAFNYARRVIEETLPFKPEWQTDEGKDNG